ncbi:hypothetical protein D3C76_1641220 [compost metagenome]
MAKLSQFSGGASGLLVAYSPLVLKEANSTTTIGIKATNAAMMSEAYLKMPASVYLACCMFSPPL